jgi:hypothetical protein
MSEPEEKTNWIGFESKQGIGRCEICGHHRVHHAQLGEGKIGPCLLCSCKCYKGDLPKSLKVSS